jgi:hypothetical protein
VPCCFSTSINALSVAFSKCGRFFQGSCRALCAVATKKSDEPRLTGEPVDVALRFRAAIACERKCFAIVIDVYREAIAHRCLKWPRALMR